ncbi:MAG: hypothetical protein ABH803_03065 [Candidatus Micrarchaeota archaeon]
MKPFEKKQLLDKVLKRLSGKTVLVEGKRDAQAITALCEDAVVVLALGKADVVLKKIPGKNAVLLFDFDKEGLRKKSFFKVFLEENGFRVDTVTALRLRSALGFLFVEDAFRKYEELLEELNEVDRNG